MAEKKQIPLRLSEKLYSEIAVSAKKMGNMLVRK